MTCDAGERRAARRHARIEEHGIIAARIRPGHRVRIVDVSVAGALVETAHRLLPGRPVELLLETSTRRAAVRGRVLRCSVVKVRSSAICYRGAIAFDKRQAWLENDEDSVAALAAGACTKHPNGAHATPQVV